MSEAKPGRALGLLGRKVGMTRIFTDEGETVPVTVLDVSGNRVTQVKTVETDGYSAIQVAHGRQKPTRLSKPLAGHYVPLHPERAPQHRRGGSEIAALQRIADRGAGNPAGGVVDWRLDDDLEAELPTQCLQHRVIAFAPVAEAEIFAVPIGLVAGLAATLFGGAGLGALSQPGLRVLGLTPIETIATALTVIFPAALLSAFRYRESALIQPDVVLRVGASGVPFATTLPFSMRTT